MKLHFSPRVACVAVLMLTGFWPLYAAAAPSPPTRAVCVDGTVDKEKLGFALFEMYGVSRAFESSLPPSPRAPFNTLPVWQRVLTDDMLCPSGGPCSDAFRKRFQKDITAARAAYFHLKSMLNNQQEAYKNPTNVRDVLPFLVDPNTNLLCRADHPAEPTAGQPTAALIDKILSGFRIRGSTDGLFFSRGMPQFKSLEPAVVGFNNDDVKNTRTDRLVAVVGYAFDFHPTPVTTFELIPYVGTNRNVVNKEDKPATFSQETVNFGFLSGLYAPVPLGKAESGFGLGNWFTLRPDYLLDLQDNSRLFSLNATYTPVITAVVNDYIRVVPGWDDFLWVRPIFDVRLNAGLYTNRGTIDPGHRQDYTRLGTQFGIALSSDIPYLPLDLVVTDTFLHGFSGAYDQINYFKALLTFSFDPKRYFGVNLSYSDGRRLDTGLREKLWSVSLTARY